jgi:sugar/nucleoside kinase (ribokinase family)
VIVCTLGDVLLDVIVRLERPLQPGDDVGARTELRAGGQAANVAAWVAALGGQARWIGRRGGPGAVAGPPR